MLIRSTRVYLLQFGTPRAYRTIGYQADGDEQDSQDRINGVQLLVPHIFLPAAFRTFTFSRQGGRQLESPAITLPARMRLAVVWPFESESRRLSSRNASQDADGVQCANALIWTWRLVC
jgi:hypothetical protein